MKIEFLHKKNNPKLILFFNGWGMNKAIINHLECTEFDVLCFSDYTHDFNFDKKLLEPYQEVYLIAWSMGVWAASRTIENNNILIKKSIAINGTLKPIDDKFGIPVSIFEGTINNFSDRNKMKFDRRMLGSKEDFNWYKNLSLKRENHSQLEELKIIYKNAINTTIDFTFDKIIIGQKDLIFPANNQIRFWMNKGQIIEIDCPHFPFIYFNSWSDIIGVNE